MTMQVQGACYGPGTDAIGDANEYRRRIREVVPAATVVQVELSAQLIAVPGGFFEMGARHSSFPADLDSPRRRVHVSAFQLAPGCVTNAEFARFVTATGYVTVAERLGWSYVFAGHLDDPADWPDAPPGTPWWRSVSGACWHAPEGKAVRSTTGRITP